MSFSIRVNKTDFQAEEGQTILDVLNENGIRVPTLCHMKGMLPSGACRMCVVEDNNTGNLIPSCSQPAADGMDLQTHSPRVVEARKSITELLLSNHPDDCLYCVRNNNCELQSLSKQLGVNERRISGEKNRHFMDRSSASITRDPAKCILCGRCVRVCEEVMGVSAIDFINRGSNSVIGTAFNEGLNTSSCVNCGQCILACPTGALSEKTSFTPVREALNDPGKTVVVQYAPAISVSLAEEFNMDPGSDINGIMNAALRRLGFDKVFDTSLSADLTIMEEASELIHRITSGETMPMITSCCPGWVKFAEQSHTDLLPNVSSCKSPQQMLGAVVKSYWADKEGVDPENIYVVSIMPCTAKKFESAREEMESLGHTDVDAVLTTRELGQFIRMHGIDMKNLEPGFTDSPLGTRSTAGKLFAASGGVMEAAIRTAYHMLTGKELEDLRIEAVRGMQGRKETKINIDGLELGFAVVSGLKNASVLLDEIRNGRDDLHFIEIMACPSGCVNGGGQHIGADENAVLSRMKSIYNIDSMETLRVSHKNPDIMKLYSDYLEEPLGHKSHELLHTQYEERPVMK